jgi:hypothetical protein
MSVIVFLSAGLMVRFSAKDGETPILGYLVRSLDELPLWFIAVWLGILTLIAVPVGWVLQSVAVVILDRRNERQKNQA